MNEHPWPLVDMPYRTSFTQAVAEFQRRSDWEHAAMQYAAELRAAIPWQSNDFGKVWDLLGTWEQRAKEEL